ncbi:hypothetical protein [Streptomyces hilarionis]|uniref:hypothetical protein n=1 Tax=Streptomyces hilarionis TaxID=2839954 RepID=UPI002119D864|nr:hypothetical protein [Streptomyces hilarionis]MCQ9136497.1 hypothetical protein [Streptomyces hilarionis]
MASAVPSDDDVLRAVERRLAERGAPVDLRAPGAAKVSWQSLFEFRVDRSIEKRHERVTRQKGTSEDIEARPTYTDLDAYPVAPPDDPARTYRHRLVREGTVDEVPCDGCVGGRTTCGTCKGRGGMPCPPDVECEDCHGGVDACWECDGTGTPRTRRARAGSRPRGPDAPERAVCRRCGRRDVACPTCRGRTRKVCTDCDGTASTPCKECRGAKRVTHRPCGGAGRFTVWTEGVVAHLPDPDEVRLPGPQFAWLKTDLLGVWMRAELTGVTDALPDFLEDGHRDLIARHLPARENEVRRRMTFAYLPLARVEVHGHPDRVYYAFPAVTGIEVARRPSRRRVTALAWAATAVAALVVAVSLAVLR